MRARGQQRAGVVGERDVAGQQHDRARRSPRRRRRRSRSCRRSRSRRGWRARAAASRAPGRRSRRRAPASTRRRRAWPRAAAPAPSSSATRGSLSSSPSSSAIAARRARVGVAPGRRPRGVGLGLDGRGERLEQRGRLGVDGQVADLRGVLPGAVGIDEHLDGVEAREPLAQRLGRRQVADAQDRARARGLRERRDAQQRVVVRDGAGAARAPESGSASSGQPVRSLNAAAARASGLSSPATVAGRSLRPRTTTPRGAAATTGASVAAAAPASDARGRCPTQGRPSGRPPPPGSSSGSGSSSTSGSRSGRFRCTGPGRGAARGPDGAAGERADPAQRLRRRVVHADLGEHPHGVAVELHLVDRLARRRVARSSGGRSAVRTISGTRASLRLDHRRQVVRRRGPGRAREHRRPAGRLREAEREEPGAALVDLREAREAAGRAPATARAASSASPGEVTAPRDAAAAELVAERAQQQVGVGRSGHDQGDARDARPPARVRRHRARLGPRRRASWTRTLYGARPGPARPRRRGPARGRSRSRRSRADVLAAAPTRFALVRLLDGRPDRARTSRSPRPSASARLVLVATTAGIDDAARARGAPRRRRARSPSRSRATGIEAFADRWLAQPLFAGRSAGGAGAAPAPTSRATTPAGLAAALRGIGTGRDGAALGPARRARRCRCVVLAGRARREVHARSPSGSSAALPDAELRGRPGRRARAAARGAGRGRRGRSTPLTAAGSRKMRCGVPAQEALALRVRRAERVEVLQAALGRDHREVRAEQDLVPPARRSSSTSAAG